MKRIYSILGFLLAILIFGWVVHFTFRDVNAFELLGEIDAMQLVLNLALGSLYFFSFGYLMKMVYQHQYAIDVSWKDTFLLPFMMHLWTYILPAKGGLIFQTVFIKVKYRIGMSKGFSVGVLVFVASLLITCVLGGLLSLQLDNAGPLQLVLLGMFGTLLFFLFAGTLMKQPAQEKSGFLNTLKGFIQNVLVQFRDQTKDQWLLTKVLAVTLLSTLIHAGWFFHSAYILHFDPNVTGIVLATLILRIVTLIRILPGNLGIQEVMIGTVFMAAGLGLEEGLMTALLVRMVSVSLAATLGVGGLYINFRYFGTDSIHGLFSKLINSKQTSE